MERSEWRPLHSAPFGASIKANGSERYSFRRHLIMLLVVLFASLEAKEGNQLQKVFLHTLEPNQSDKAHIELAKLVFYFTSEPEIRNEQVRGTDAKHAKLKFFFPGVGTAQEVAAMIAAANSTKTNKYKFQIQEVAKPSKGIELTISFDPEQIMIKHDTFDAITKAKGVEFHIYNKQLLQDLQAKGTHVLRTSQAKKPMIIIDCGHGGTDMGTIGCFSYAEKNITLAVGKELEKQLKKSGYTVCMTRSSDVFVPLDQRTRIANQKENALLISLHANNSASAATRGLETFCLDTKLFKPIDTQLATAIDVMIQSVDEQRNVQSKKFAQTVHSSLLTDLHAKGYDLLDRKVKHAATQVLMGIKWPGILIELDFLSNEKSAKLLNTPEYQQHVAQAICAGVIKFGAA